MKAGAHRRSPQDTESSATEPGPGGIGGIMSEKQFRADHPMDENGPPGARLKAIREYIGLKPREVANRLGIPRADVSDIESGKRNAHTTELEGFAQLYGVPIRYLTGEGASFAVPEDLAFLDRTATPLSDNDREELKRFAEFLRARSEALTR